MADRFWVGDSGTWSDYTNHWSATSGGAGGASKPTSSDSVYFDFNSISPTALSPTITQDESIDCLNMSFDLGKSLSAGTPTALKSGIYALGYPSMTSLGSGKSLFINNGTAWVLTQSASAITAGSPVDFETGTISYTSVTLIDTNKVLVAYCDASNSNYGTACVLSISGSTITAGVPFVFNSNTTYYISVTEIDTNKAIVVYRDVVNSNYGTACVLSVSGTTVTAGDVAVFESAKVTIYSSSIVKISTNKAIVVYIDEGNSNYGTSCLFSIVGTTITAEAPVVFNSSDSRYMNVCLISTDKALVAFGDVGNSGYGTSCVLSISGTTITAGAIAVFESASTGNVSLCCVSADKAIVFYSDNGNSAFGTTCFLYISGTTITSSSAIVFEGSNTSLITCCLANTDEVTCAYNDVITGATYGVTCAFNVTDIYPRFYSNISAYYINVYGNLSLVSKVDFTGSYGGNFVFKATSAGKTIKTDGSIFYKLHFIGDGGAWTFQDNVYTGYFDTLSGADITLDLDSFTINASKDFTMNTSVTLTAGTSTIVMSGNDAIFGGSGKTYNNVWLTGDSILITGSNTYSELKFTAGKTITVTSGTNQTLVTMPGNGNSSNFIIIKSSIFGIPFTITNNSLAVTVDYYSITDCTAVGILFTANNSVDIGGNTDWIFTSGTDYTLYDSIYRGNSLHIFDVDKKTWFAWKENITSIQEGYDETIFIRDIDGFNYEQSETYYTRDRDLTNAGVYVDIPWEFITKSYMGGISQKETLTDISLHYKCSTNATVNVGYSEQSTNLLSTSFHSLAATSDFTIDNKDHIKRILIPSTALQNVDYYNLRFNGTGKFTLYGMEQNFRVKKR